MELNAYFKSLVDQDRAAVVICDPEHTIIYMNPPPLPAMQSMAVLPAGQKRTDLPQSAVPPDHPAVIDCCR